MMKTGTKRYGTGGGFLLVLVVCAGSSPVWVSSSGFATGLSSVTATNRRGTGNHLYAQGATEIISVVGDDGFFSGDPADTPFRSPNMTGALQTSGLGPPFVDLDIPVSNSGLGYTHSFEVPDGFLIAEATLFVRIYPGHGGNFLALDRNVNGGQVWGSGFGPRAVFADVLSEPVEAGVLTDILLDLSSILMRPNEGGDPAFDNLIPELYDGEFNVGVAGDTGVDYSVLTVTVLPDCNGNSVDDADDIAGGFSDDCDLNGIPDECDPDCNADGIPDACDTISPDGIINVPADFATIQDAIDTACDGAEVLVALGTYNEVINFLGKAITLRSSDGPDVTVIDGTGLNDSVVKCVSGEGPTTVLDGFTITGGSTGFGGFGGGILVTNSGPTIRDCRIFNNSSAAGGGIAFLGSNVNLSQCRVEANAAIGAGESGFAGGMYVDALSVGGTITDCQFLTNTAPFKGGGVLNAGAPLIFRNCLWQANTNSHEGAGYMASGGSANHLFVNCSFLSNVSLTDDGGGIKADGGFSATNCLFWNNHAGCAGGAFRNEGGDVSIVNCTFADNTSLCGGDAIHLDAPGQSTISNSVIWNGLPWILIQNGATLEVNDSNIEGGFAGDGNIDIDPLFADSLNGDLRLMPESPSIDGGDNASLPSDDADLDGDGDTLEPTSLDLDGLPRTVCDVDMGAYEFQTLLVPQSSDPPACAIDARQPHDPINPEARFGWTQVTLDFGCVITPPLPGFSVTVEDGTPPAIIDAIASENMLTLVLDEPIPPGQWTCFTHDASGAQTCLGYLPADVNGDGVSSPSDILSVIDSLNGVVPRPEFATDVDRSGASGPADILRVIDLLNGAAAFEPWLDVMLNDCPSGN